MADPQLENGHTQIANELLDKLAQLYLSPNQWQVVIFIIRKTYGFHKKVDYIANSQIIEGTGLNKAVVSRILRSLNDRTIITRDKKHIGFQKDWELWKLPKQSTIKSCLNCQPKLPKQSTELPKQSTKVDSSEDTQKIKETKQKKLIQKIISIEHFNKFWDAYPKKRNKGQAEKAFEKAVLDEQLLAVILTAIEQAKKSAQWLEADGKYIPYPATWLNAKGWEDEYTEEGKNGESKRCTKSIPGNRPAGAFEDLQNRD